MSLEPRSESPHLERRRVPRTITPLSTPAIVGGHDLKFPLGQEQLTQRVREALDEDGAFNDITTIATVLSDRHARARLVAREAMTVCGMPFAVEAFRQLDPKISIRVDVEDGMRAGPASPVLFLTGHARALLAAERVALNFLQRLSGIASLTWRYVDAVRGTGAQIIDTRKTLPGWRTIEKYAVRAGGGRNHRMDLASAVLIKDNHLASCDGSVHLAVRRARELTKPGTPIEVECDRMEQVEDALDAKADIILLDNMPLALLRECVAIAKGKATLEASGGVRLDTVRAIAETGVDWISVGELTHSARAVDLGLDFD